MEKSFAALMCALLILSPPFLNAGFQQLGPEMLLCLHENRTFEIEIEGVIYTIPVNKTYILFRNGTKIYNAFVDAGFVRINYTKVIQPFQEVQSNLVYPTGDLVRGPYDGLLFIYDCPLNSIYYGHPDHYFTYPDEEHLMCWNYPWNKTGNTKNHIHITQDEISAMKSENAILPDLIKRALMSTFGTIVVGSLLVPNLLKFLISCVGTAIGFLLVAIVVFVIWVVAWLIADAVEAPSVADFIQSKVELYHHDGFMWTWEAEKGIWGIELSPPLEKLPGHGNWYNFFALTTWYYIKFALAFGKELWEGTTHYFIIHFSIPKKYYIALG